MAWLVEFSVIEEGKIFFCKILILFVFTEHILHIILLYTELNFPYEKNRVTLCYEMLCIICALFRVAYVCKRHMSATFRFGITKL
jgi:hypothetical protein